MHRRSIVSILIGILFIFADSPAQGKKRITPELAYQTPALVLTTPLPSIGGWNDDGSYFESKKKEGETASRALIIDAATGEERGVKPERVQWDSLKSAVPEGVDVKRYIQSDEKRGVFIYAHENDLFLLNGETGAFSRLTNDTSAEKNPTLSPDGRFVAFTRNNDLYGIELATRAETRYTSDGSDVVYNGWAAWVYWEEIFGRSTRYRAFWWSPNSDYIAYYRFDESLVPMFPIYNSEGQHGFLERTRYPKAGDPNPEVKLGIVAISTAKTAWADFSEKDDQYFGMPFWTPDGKALWTQWMNRGQDDLKVYAIDPSTGKKKEIYDEKQPSWVEWFDNMHFLEGGKGVLWKSDKDGWNHIYLHGMDGRLMNRVTEGKWQVSTIECVDEKNRQIFFTARREASTRTDLYRVGFNGKGLKRLTFGEFTHQVQVSPGGSYFITTYSNVNTPPKMALCDRNGKLIRELGDSRSAQLDEYYLAKTQLITIPTADGYQLPALLTLPPDMDPAKKYPVLISVYGGPAAGTVSDGWRLSMQTQSLASEGLIQLSVDHRASGHFGKEGVALMHRNLGKWEMHDYIEAVKWLRSQPYVDAGKVCITGGSYGGYVTCMALTYGAEYFTHGIASFSVTDWKLYDTHYTERYMDTPSENPEGYRNGSVMTFADQYRGMLRVVHGSMDDNVHLQNSIQLIDTLQNLNKHFEFMVYPGERHGWGPPKSNHSRMEAMRFYYSYLLEKEFPEQVFMMAGK